MKKVLAIFAALALVGVLVLGGGYFYYRSEVDGTGAGGQSQQFVVEQGETPTDIAKALKEAGIINSDLFFRLYLKQTGTGPSLQYGTFSLRAGMSYDEIITELQTPAKRQDVVRVTFPEGNTLIQFAKAMEEAGLCTAQQFIDEANNGDFSDIPFWSQIDTDPNTFMKAEGYLFPDTYEFYQDDTVHNMVAKLFSQFNGQITDEMTARMKELGLSLRETITLASLIQEEAGDPANMPGVSGVFHNRLKPGSPYPKMGSDVTWYYISDFIRPYYATLGQQVPDGLEDAYYTGDNDPNSRTGLPAGPLSNPGIDAIKAALYPEDNDYYFFLTDANGKYYYAKTYDEHLANIQKMKSVNAEVKASIGGV